MNISVEVTGSILEYLNSKVGGGHYKSRSEVIRTAIREMIQRDLEELLRANGIKPEDLANMRDEVAGEIIGKKYRDLA